MQYKQFSFYSMTDSEGR